MNSIESLRALFRHMEWADAAVWNVVLAADAARADIDLHARLRHEHGVQRAFLEVWRGLPLTPPASGEVGLDSLARSVRETHERIAAYVAEIEAKDLGIPVAVPWMKRVEERVGRRLAVPDLGETLHQVVMHSMYHRGQINGRLRQLGCDPPQTDFIAWVWLDKPAPDWNPTKTG